jgi:hypothetical protein
LAELSLFAAAAGLMASLAAGTTLLLLPKLVNIDGVRLDRLELFVDLKLASFSLLGAIALSAAGAWLPVGRIVRGASISRLVATPREGRGITLRKVITAGYAASATAVLVIALTFVRIVTADVNRMAGFDSGSTLFVSAQAVSPLRDSSTAWEMQAAAARADMQQAIAEIRLLPGVDGVAAGPAPLGPDRARELAVTRAFEISGQRRDGRFGFVTVGPEYLAVLKSSPDGSSILRTLVQDEAVVTPAFADILAADQSPVGREFRFGGTSYRIAAVQDIAYGSLRLGPAPAVFVVDEDPARQFPIVSLAIRTRSPTTTRRSVRQVFERAFPDAPVLEMLSGAELVARDIGRERIGAWFFSVFGALAFGLSATGGFALAGYTVELRRHEFGIRLALGATRRHLLRRIVVTSVNSTLMGIGLGSIAVFWISHTLRASVPGFSIAGPSAYTWAAVSLMLGGTAAGLAGAWPLRTWSDGEVAAILKN